MIWSFVVLQEIFLCATIFAAEEDSRSAYLITRENKQLLGHVVKRFESRGLMSCSQSCLRNPWCTSTNFKESSKKNDKGVCELNKEIAPVIEDNKLIDQRGVTFSAFLKGCLLTGCLNGGSCLFDEKKETFTCSCKQQWSGDRCELKTNLKSCQEHKSMGENLDGIYNIKPDGQGILSVFCDQTTDGGGWTVVQRRISPFNVSFDRVWTEYRNGFGDLLGEFWLGNDNLHRIATSASVLRFDLTADSGKKGYAKYGGFTVGDAATKFQWDMNTYKGNIGNAIYGSPHKWQNVRGMKFSTKDEDNDNYSGGACDPGWWLNHCGKANLNSRSGPVWGNWDTIVYTEMKIRMN